MTLQRHLLVLDDVAVTAAMDKQPHGFVSKLGNRRIALTAKVCSALEVLDYKVWNVIQTWYLVTIGTHCVMSYFCVNFCNGIYTNMLLGSKNKSWVQSAWRIRAQQLNGSLIMKDNRGLIVFRYTSARRFKREYDKGTR